MFRDEDDDDDDDDNIITEEDMFLRGGEASRVLVKSSLLVGYTDHMTLFRKRNSLPSSTSDKTPVRTRGNQENKSEL